MNAGAAREVWAAARDEALEGNFLASQLWDHFHPGWREYAADTATTTGIELAKMAEAMLKRGRRAG